jgi:hypothetical protein
MPATPVRASGKTGGRSVVDAGEMLGSIEEQ